MGSTSLNPTGSPKAAIDAGKAMALNMGDRGDLAPADERAGA
jgi:hypothetical protein